MAGARCGPALVVWEHAPMPEVGRDGSTSAAVAMPKAGWHQVGWRNLSGSIVALHHGVRSER